MLSAFCLNLSDFPSSLTISTVSAVVSVTVSTEDECDTFGIGDLLFGTLDLLGCLKPAATTGDLPCVARAELGLHEVLKSDFVLLADATEVGLGLMDGFLA